ncbi:MAG: glycosyltransferase [Bacilli bacterium]|nr:glycosyltransferase [Bacilli bacterium]
MSKKFKFSVIIPVYNVEEYLEETIESVVNQTIGFEDNIQLVLINDGSPDNSEEICLKYKELYPDNVVYKKQQNAGVSKARNNGIKLAEGELVNFLDSDDKWDLETFTEVWKQYENHKDVGIFTTKMKYFDAVSRPHILNYKFIENKVVDITKDYAYPQLSTCSCFVKGSILKNYEYDASIKNEEDTKMISEILLDNPKMMVLEKPIYFYRKRPDQSSASQTSTKNPLWYTVTPKKVYEYLFEESKKRYGKVLDYFQYLVAYDLGWRINIPVPEDLLSESEKKDYINTITKLIKEIDFKFFLEQKNNYPTYSILLLKIKEGLKPEDLLEIKDGNVEVKRLDEKNNCIQFLRVDDIFESKGKIYLYGRFNNTIFNKNKIKLSVNGKTIKPDFYELKTDYDEKAFNDEYLGKYTGFKCCIDTKDLSSFGFTYDDNESPLKLIFSNQTLITNQMPGSYFTFGKEMICYDDGKFTLKKKSFGRLCSREFKIAKGLLAKKRIKVLLMRWLIILSKLLPYKNVWLLSDRVNMADDNAEHLFKYINDHKIKGINPYYVISKESKDFNRLKQYGKVVSNTSLKYKILFNNAKYIVSSHAEVYITNIYGKSNPFYRNLFKFKYAFLQHGITQADISPWLNPNTKHIDMFVSAVDLEYKSLQNNGYNKDIIQLTGFPRYDGLVAKSKKYEQKILSYSHLHGVVI